MRRAILAAFILTLISGHAEAQTTTAATNQLVCGDASTCPNQRGTASVGGTITNTAVMTLDYWSAIAGASSALTISAVAPLSSISGITTVMQMQRTAANANLAPLNLGQVLDTDVSTFMQGKTACLSFVSMIGATFSPQLAAFTYSVFAGTGTVQGYASMVAGTWTNTVTVATGTVTGQTLPQYTSRCFQVPGNATEIGVNFSWVPFGTAGATDLLQLSQVQLAASSAPAATAVAPPYSFRTSQSEYELALRRAYIISEPVTSGIANGNATSTTVCSATLQFMTPMRAIPTVTFTNIAAGANWQVYSGSATPNSTSSPFLVQSAIGANTKLTVNLQATVASGLTAGNGCYIAGGTGTGRVNISADLL